MYFENLYNYWLENVQDPLILKDLESIKNNNSEKHERFYQNLEFGTAGLRGIMGAGTARMNIYNVRRATQGLANYLNEHYKNASVAISFDSRKNSLLFARETACVLASNNIKAYISKNLMPTPFLSFCVRHFKCKAGVMITASHNPPEYNGYKCYGEDGAQMNDALSPEVYNHIEKVDIFKDVKIMDFNTAIKQKLICFIDESATESYIDCVLSQTVNNFAVNNINVTYTPLNGAGAELVKKVLKKRGLENLNIVRRQENPDENFTTCKSPNPELKSAFDLAVKLAEKHSSDVIIATDPDADRLGVCVKHKDEYRILSGNQIGLILLDYIINARKSHDNLPSRPVVIKTIVSTEKADLIAKKHGCEVINVFTGFKNIASEILKLEQTDTLERFVFGFEESNGYLCGAYARDKDAVCAAMLVCEAASYYKKNNVSLLEILENLEHEYGYFYENTLNFNFKGSEGKNKIKNFMESLRIRPPKSIADKPIILFKDYLNETPLKSDMIIFRIQGNHRVIIRPSGTEPKIKVYVTAVGQSKREADSTGKSIEKEIEQCVKNI